MVILDTSGLPATMDSGQRRHAVVREALEKAAEPFIVSPFLSLFVLAEPDYLVATKVGREAEPALLGEVERGAYRLEPFSAEDAAQAEEVIEQYSDFADLDLADASNVVLAVRHDAHDILTLDERHFLSPSGPHVQSFRLLPAEM